MDVVDVIDVADVTDTGDITDAYGSRVSNEQSRLSVALSRYRYHECSVIRGKGGWQPATSASGDVEGLPACRTETIGLAAQAREKERERERCALFRSSFVSNQTGMPVSLAGRTMTQERARIPNEPFSLMTHDQGLFVLHLRVY